MAFKFFWVPIRDGGSAEAELNAFLRGHRVLEVDRRWIDRGGESLWCFCVDYVEAGSGATIGRAAGQRSKVDYKELLRPEEFVVFARLRELRKEIAQAEAVPVYTVFTNEQLAQMAQRKAHTKADLEQIGGLGGARLEKYGPRMLELLKSLWSADDAPRGESVAPGSGT